MKVFLSWSGPTSKEVALALRDWLPSVIQAVEPWMSSEDIEKGARWSADVANELAMTKAGIICLTVENREAPWLNFEAGALSKTVDKEMVCPYLFRMKPSDLTGPIVQFQASEAIKEDTHKMVATLNRATPKPLSNEKLSEAFNLWWVKLEERLSAIPSFEPQQTPKRSTEDLLEEILSIVRDQSRSVPPPPPPLEAIDQIRLQELSNKFVAITTHLKSLLAANKPMPEQIITGIEPDPAPARSVVSRALSGTALPGH